MKLYYSPGACSLAPHIMAREAGVSIELVKVDLQAHKTESGADYYAINPRGYVPALQLDDGTLLTEAGVLVQFLADQVPAAGLLPPAGSLERVHVQEWLAYIGTELHKAFGWLFYPGLPDEMQKIVRGRIARRFSEVDKHLGAHAYLAGDRFTAADTYGFTIMSWSNFMKIDLAPYPNIKAYLARVASRPKVQEALQAEGLLKR